ncbi:glycosyltransferase involved in cell wall biosynthesis [Salinibacter ruber]|nr:glycosyltransferase involved in cell wall biosynthesis [Salinibacter ruber]
METPPLTVLIPTYGRPTLLERALASLSECELPRSYRELVVIENGSRAGAEQIVADLPERMNARYMHRERGNKSYALNEALATIEDGLVVFFDDDVQVHSDTLQAYSQASAAHGCGHFFGGTVHVDREQAPPAWVEPSLPDSAKGYLADGRREDKYYLGFNWAAYSGELKNLGGFNPRFGPGASTSRRRNSKRRPSGSSNRPCPRFERRFPKAPIKMTSRAGGTSRRSTSRTS